MINGKQILKAFIPPIVFSIIRKLKKPIEQPFYGWAGDYATWGEAKANCTGYDTANILETCKNSLLKVKTGEAVYERDSVLFNEIQYSWGLLAGLEKAALENNGNLCVLDFGGSLGSTYYQNKEFLSSIKNLTWCIVEQAHFVDCGKQNFENKQLKFYHTIEACMTQHKPNVLLLSGVLQYLEKPEEWIDKLTALKIDNIIIDRTTIVDCEKNIITIQKVPSTIYNASYPCWFFNENKFEKLFKEYLLVAKFESFCDPSKLLNNKYQAVWRGYQLKFKQKADT